MRTKAVLFLLLMALVLSGCALPAASAPAQQAVYASPAPVQNGQNEFVVILPTTTPGSLSVEAFDANNNLATAQADYVAVQRQVIEATSQAQATQSAYNFSVTATREAFEIALVAAAATGTRQAEEMQATMTLQASNMQATSMAQSAAFSAQSTSVAFSATQEAQNLIIAQNAQVARQTQQNAQLWSVLTPLLVTITALLGLGLIAYYVMMQLQALTLQKSLVETRAGTVVFVLDDAGRRIPQLLTREPLQLNSTNGSNGTAYRPVPDTDASIIDAIPFTAMGKTRLFLKKQDVGMKERRQLVRQFIWDCMQQNGGFADQVPGYRDLEGWSAEKWSRAVTLLKAASVVETIPRQGTFLTSDWPTLTDVLNAIDQHKLTLPHSERVSVNA